MRLHHNPEGKKGRHLLGIFFTTATLLFLFVTFVQANADEDRNKHDRVIAMYEEYTKNFPGVKDIGSEDALLLLSSDDAVFVDVREAKEQKVSMIPGAVTREL